MSTLSFAAPAGLYQPELAGPDDLPTIQELFDDARSWLSKKNTDQWAAPWPSEHARNDRIRASLAAGSTWIMRDGLTPVATVTAQGTPCRDGLWLPEELERPALYLHRLIVRRSHAGKGIGAWLIDWASWRAVQKYAAESIRIDVWTTNIALQKYYQGLGFQWLRNEDAVPGNPSGALYARPISRTGPPVTTTHGTP